MTETGRTARRNRANSTARPVRPWPSATSDAPPEDPGPERGATSSRAGEAAGAAIVLILAALLAALVLTGRSRHYVQPLLTPVLGLTAAVLLALAAWTLWALRGSRRRVPGARRPRAAAWLLLIPAILAIASPTPLGSALLTSRAVGGGRAGAAHGEGGAVAVDAWTGERIDLAARDARSAAALPALDPDPGAATPLTLAELGQYWSSGRHDEIFGARVTVVGFAAPDGTGGWLLGRFQIVCCAADAVPYQGAPAMPIARLTASLLAAVLVGWAWIMLDGDARLALTGGDDPHDDGAACDARHEHHGHGDRRSHAHGGGGRLDEFRATAMHDLLEAGGFLVVGAMVAGLVRVAVPGEWFTALGDFPWAAALVMAGLAVLLSLCSEADAFVVASFTGVPATAQLVFLVVGPMVDLKLVAMQYGAFGRRFVARFVPLALGSAIICALAVGPLLLHP